jgi:hypothetical protein
MGLGARPLKPADSTPHKGPSPQKPGHEPASTAADRTQAGKRAIVRHASANAAPKSNDERQQALAYRMTIRSRHHANPPNRYRRPDRQG